MYTILAHMIWPYYEFRMQVCNVLHCPDPYQTAENIDPTQPNLQVDPTHGELWPMSLCL